MTEWKEYKFSDFVEINPSVKIPKGISVSFVEMKDLDSSVKYCESSQKKELTGGSRFINGDTLFARITPCMENGKGGLVRNMKSKICMGSTEFHVLRACANVSTDFIYQLTISKRFRQKAEMQMTGSAGQQRVPAAFLEDYFISIPFKNDVPDLAEQRRIAAILSGIDAKIAAEEKVLEKYEKVKKGMMEKMLQKQ